MSRSVRTVAATAIAAFALAAASSAPALAAATPRQPASTSVRVLVIADGNSKPSAATTAAAPVSGEHAGRHGRLVIKISWLGLALIVALVLFRARRERVDMLQ
jgi:hypothetical protein